MRQIIAEIRQKKKLPLSTSALICLFSSALLFGTALLNPCLAQRREGFASLKIPVGAREAALAGTGTASAIGPQALAYNPALSARDQNSAGTGTISPFSAQVSYTRWFLDTHHQSLFVSRNLRHFSLGLGVVAFSGGSVEYREEIPTEEPLGTFSPLDLTAYFNIARSFATWVDAGINARFFYSKIASAELLGMGADIGARFHPIKNLQLGIAVTDLGRTVYYEEEVFWLPSRLRTGIGWTMPLGNSRLLFSADGSWFFYSQKVSLQTGVEFSLNDFLSLRAGYDPLNPASHLNFGLGISAPISRSNETASNKLRLDYTFSPLGLGLGTAHRLGIGFGY